MTDRLLTNNSVWSDENRMKWRISNTSGMNFPNEKKKYLEVKWVDDINMILSSGKETRKVHEEQG